MDLRQALAAAALLMVVPFRAEADLLLVDVNDQAGERDAVRSLAREFGSDANMVVAVKTKDMLKLLEMEFARAERGETDLETLVLSGHSGTGREFYSEDGDRQLAIAALSELAAKYPKAAGQVRHLMLMGCMAGARDDIGSWSSIFPNVVVSAGFNGVGPSKGAAERFLAQVLREVRRREAEAGGADALAAQLADDQKAIDDWARTLESLDAVHRTHFGFDLCGSYHTNVKLTESTPQRIDRLMNDAFFACRDAERSCVDPRGHRGELAELFLLVEAHVRPSSTNVAFVDSRQRKLRRLMDYGKTVSSWTAANGARMDAASRSLAALSVDFPDAASFAGLDRRSQIDAALSLEQLAPTHPDAGVRAALEALAGDLRHSIVELRDPEAP